jgi:hypothetical protein
LLFNALLSILPIVSDFIQESTNVMQKNEQAYIP